MTPTKVWGQPLSLVGVFLFEEEFFYGKTITESSAYFGVHAEVAGDYSDSGSIHGELVCFFLK
ncbi:hypothetical protein CUZ96_0528 [Enterococcus lactis]|nr:hypothetical protein [Enterococcus lactis]